MRKLKFFDSKQLSDASDPKITGPGALQPSAMEFGPDGNPKKSLQDIMILRMLYMDYFFLFLGLNAQKTPDQTTLVD